jgi:hypothetical protein
MAYLINKTDGTVLATVADGQIDNLTTDLTLIGKNYSGFGESLNENFVKLLENFSSVTRPTHPIRGQIWFDVSELKLKVYNGTAFQPVSSATISNTQPTTLTPGDLWFNNVDKQLYFYDGITTLLLGPSYATSQGLSGIKVLTILDNLNQNKVITSLYSNGSLIGIFSSNDEFTPKIPIAGFSGSILPGFNPGTIAGFKFNVTATNAETLGGIPSTTYIRNDASSVINGRLGLIQGAEIGDAQQVKLFAINSDLLLQNVASNKFVRISARRGSIQEDAIVVEPATQTVKFYDGFITSQTVVGGDLTINGNLTVKGDNLSVNVSTLQVEDKNIELGISNGTPLVDADASGGGIILKGTTDHTILWSNSKKAWISSENLDLNVDKYFSIDGVPLLKKTGSTFELTNQVTLATGITIFGVQAQFTVQNLFLQGNRLSALNANGNLELAPNGSGSVALIGSPRITGLGEPSGISDAATRNYVDTQIKAKSLAFTFDISDGISNSGIAGYLELIAPVAEYQNNTIARVLCTQVTNLSTDINLNGNLTQSTATFNTPTGTGPAVINVGFSTVTIPGSSSNIIRLVKTFQIIAGTWTFVS